eukprot:gene7430-5231_t
MDLHEERFPFTLMRIRGAVPTRRTQHTVRHSNRHTHPTTRHNLLQKFTRFLFLVLAF